MSERQVGTIYLDTSALNYISNHPQLSDASNLRAAVAAGNAKFFISPVVIWELLLNGNEHKRELLVAFSQTLFEPILLPSPEEIVTKFISAGCPEIEPRYEFKSSSYLAETWREIAEDPRKTFVFDQKEIEHRKKLIYGVAKDMHAIANDRDCSGTFFDPKSTRSALIALLKQIRDLRDEVIEPPEERLYVISLFYILLMLCAGLTLFDNHAIESFWAGKQINESMEKIRFLIEKHPNIVWRGPFISMALTSYYQSKSGFSRGVLADSLHSIYLTYVDRFLSTDHHFCQLKRSVDHPNVNKISYIDIANIMAK